MRPAVFADERGMGLVEVLVSVAIVAIVFTALLTALSTATVGVATVRERVTAQTLARAQLECIQDHTYTEDATPTDYTTGCPAYSATLPAYHTELDISYWDSSTEAFTSAPGDDGGMQWITVTVYYNGESVFTIGKYKAER